MAAPATKPKVLILTGPTAVGKTRVSLALAERLNGEIISADSVQVYRGLDVGSDKVRGKRKAGGAQALWLGFLEPSGQQPCDTGCAHLLSNSSRLY